MWVLSVVNLSGYNLPLMCALVGRWRHVYESRTTAYNRVSTKSRSLFCPLLCVISKSV